MKETLENLEKFSKGITNEMMVIDLVKKLNEEGKFLSKKIEQGIRKYSIEFDQKRKKEESLGRLKANPLLLGFIGKNNIKLIENEYK